jgi:hypothetical protein
MSRGMTIRDVSNPTPPPMLLSTDLEPFFRPDDEDESKEKKTTFF